MRFLLLTLALAACTSAAPVPFPTADASTPDATTPDAAVDAATGDGFACVPVGQSCNVGHDLCCAGMCVEIPGNTAAACTASQ